MQPWTFILLQRHSFLSLLHIKSRNHQFSNPRSNHHRHQSVKANMGESETVVAQTSTLTGYTSTGYTSTGYENSTDAVPEAAGTESGMSSDLSDSIALKDASSSLTDVPNLGDESTNVMPSVSVMQEAPDTDATVDTSQVSDYGSSVNGTIASEVTNLMPSQNGTAPGDVGIVTAEHPSEDASAMSAEDRLWNMVRANSLDFNAWTALIEETEKVAENNITKIRRVYDHFLAEFPLCYGYWKKYADHEVRLASVDKVVKVYERAVQGVTYSVEIWLHYCTFSISTFGDPDTIRRLFERGLAFVGTDYLSFPLWDKYIEYEYTQQEWSRLALIYTRILENPNQQLERYCTSFKELALSRPLLELRTAEEVAAAGSLTEAGSKEAEAEVHSDAKEQSSIPASAGSIDSEGLEKYMAIREDMYKKSKEFDSKIIGFETAIRRPYFHVRPLNVAELENWHHYLDFIESEADINKIIKLYERCLIACANYPEYWIRYVLCMETFGSMDLANNALARATQVFVKRQPEIHLFNARFKEHTGDFPGARAVYQLLHSEISPGHLEAIVKHANMVHRRGNPEDAFYIYEQAIAVEKGKEHSQTLAMVFAQYSRFVYMVMGNAEKARGILAEALEHVQLSKPLLEALIHLESTQSLPKRIDYLDSLVEKFVGPGSDNGSLASATEREEISCIFSEFLDLFGDNQSIKKADDRHAKYFLNHRCTSELRKRHAEDFLASEKAKLAKSDSVTPSPGQAATSAYPAAQNQWATGYGVQPQAWPQVAQVQGQQWNGGYSQQSAYNGYGSSYSNPQIPTTVPQTAAYGSYSQTYPVQQTYPLQNYAQPAAVTPAAPIQQPAAVPQGYYGGNYY